MSYSSHSFFLHFYCCPHTFRSINLYFQTPQMIIYRMYNQTTTTSIRFDIAILQEHTNYLNITAETRKEH
uniref:Uncharacterized protein n=1 Tax=Anguilla anguilla TaxID=7936 RepID=A0A0E9WA19_ANGAN